MTDAIARPVTGGLAALAAVSIVAGWQVATRAGLTTGTLAPPDLALLRYGVPALLLLPVLLRHGLWPVASPGWLMLPLLLGGGLPFGLLAMWGAQYAPVAHMGALVPGTMPLFTACLAAMLLGERPGRRRLAGFGIVGCGVGLIAGQSLTDIGAGTLPGDGLFLTAALIWAGFTVAYRAAGLSGWHATALVSAGSALLALPLWLASGTGRLLALPWAELAWHAATQGLVAGVAGFWSYAVAIRHLGAPRAALSGALVPALAALGGAVLLAEWPAPLVLAGVCATMGGLVVAAWPTSSRPTQRPEHHGADNQAGRAKGDSARRPEPCRSQA